MNLSKLVADDVMSIAFACTCGLGSVGFCQEDCSFELGATQMA